MPPTTLPPRPRTLHQSTLWAIDPRHYSAPALPASINADLTSRLKLSAQANTIGKAVSSAPEVDPTRHMGEIAVIDIAGALRKSPSIFRVMGCTDEPTTPEIEAAIRRAAVDERVSATLLRISSPGGELFGTPQVADAVFDHRQVKPIVAYIEDLGASAAYWIASQATEVVAHRIGHVGSIGVFAVLVDSSEKAAAAGLKFHLVASTSNKGHIAAGAITLETIEALQEQIGASAALFLEDIARGRGLSRGEAEDLHDGRLFVGEQARARGLVDRIENIDETLARLQPAPDAGDPRRVERHEALAKLMEPEVPSTGQGAASTD